MSLKHYSRTPDFLVKITRPNYASSTFQEITIGEFKSNVLNNYLINYSFSESLESVSDSFSLSFTNAYDKDGKTWLDKIFIRDLVYVYEFSKLKFIGIVSSKRMSARITGGSPNKTINVSGVSIANLLASFPLIIDQFLYQGNTLAEAANQSLKAKLTQQMEDGYPISNILTVIYESFFELTLKMGTTNVGGLGVKSVLDKYIDFGSKLSKTLVLKYPIALSIYSVGTNNIWDILTNIIVPPIYEFYVMLNENTEKYEVVFRQSPFESDDWKLLKDNIIPATHLTDYDLMQSDNEIYTYYLCTVAGAGISDRKGMLLDSSGYGALSSQDEIKWRKYGYRPMIVEFRYFDSSKAETYTTTANTMQELSSMLKEWYSKNDEFLMGDINMMTPNEFEYKAPRIGEKIKFLGGEFYIESVDHSWSYNGPMELKISVSRGYVYNNDGSKNKQISDISRKLYKIDQYNGEY